MCEVWYTGFLALYPNFAVFETYVYMMDLEFMREDPAMMKRICKNQGLDPSLVDRLLAEDKKKSELVAQIKRLEGSLKIADNRMFTLLFNARMNNKAT